MNTDVTQNTQEQPITTPASFDDYEDQIILKEDLAKVYTLLFDGKPEDADAAELGRRLLEDKLIVRQKYNLPNEKMLEQPDEYYHQLELIARKEEVPLRSKEEFQSFFRERLASNVFLGSHDGVIAHSKKTDNDTRQELASKSISLAHELIHAMQWKRYPQMPQIRKEYEAYIAHANEEVLESEPWLFLERIALSLSASQLEEAWNEYSNSAEIKPTPLP